MAVSRAFPSVHLNHLSAGRMTRSMRKITRNTAWKTSFQAEICAGFAATTETQNATSRDGTDPGIRLVREDIQRDIDALKLRVEEAFAAGRACQAFVVANGMEP